MQHPLGKVCSRTRLVGESAIWLFQGAFGSFKAHLQQEGQAAPVTGAPKHACQGGGSSNT